jgi:PcrA/UvrD helicase-like protein
MAFRVGERVLHTKFGAGLVLSVTGAGDDLAYKVSFDGDGEQRRLLARLANLVSTGEPSRPTAVRKSRARGATA